MEVGDFPEYLINQFREMLVYFGQSPIIVRSSSVLEDAYGNAFSGKYESVFCPNQGSLRTRLKAFLDAVRTIYASAMSPDAISYRQHRGLLDNEEQMALLVQRVSGSAYGSLFFPHVAGVGYSHNPFVWHEKIDPKAGCLRLVCGLGTRAVDRLENDYTRLVALNVPTLRQEKTSSDIRAHSQRRMDVLDLQENTLTSLLAEDILPDASDLPAGMVATRDRQLEREARQQGIDIYPWILTMNGLLNHTDFPETIREMMSKLEDVYQNPVDIEFALNFTGPETYRINLLQCRPFQISVGHEEENGTNFLSRSTSDQSLLLHSSGPILGQSRRVQVDYVVLVSPEKYAALPDQKKHQMARLIGDVHRHKSLQNATILLIGPGRWGTTTPAFGVPVAFQEIHNVSILCEVAVMHEGLVPDISLGTHFFNDMVELNMLYLAIFPDKERDRLDLGSLLAMQNALSDLVPAEQAKSWADELRVIDLSRENRHLTLEADAVTQRAIGYFTSN